jgi:hypothetical protein
MPIKPELQFFKWHLTSDLFKWHKKNTVWILTVYLLFFINSFLISTLAKAHEEIGINVINFFSKALPPVSRNGAVYLTIINKGEQLDRLVGATTPIAKLAEIHTHKNDDGIIRMRKVDFVEIDKKEEISLVPGGDHIMLVHLMKPLIEGEEFPLTLHFEEMGDVSITVPIKAADTVFNTASNGHKHGDVEEGQTINIENSEVEETNSSIVRFNIIISNGKVDDGDQSFRVTHDDVVEFHISSNEQHILHLHGYDVEIKVDQTSATVFQLEATATGRFPVELHGENAHHPLFYLEVYPQ